MHKSLIQTVAYKLAGLQQNHDLFWKAGSDETVRCVFQTHTMEQEASISGVSFCFHVWSGQLVPKPWQRRSELSQQEK
jgi:hypothetical protein